jgi:2-polyprenyl-6-methoxyphenol hydroxylase-like FAD-dependent oxidoreductase
MRRNDRTQVLVVGAGPVGMFTALRLAESGLGVQVIDQEARTAGRSFACSLHPRSLQLLDEAGVARDAVRLGHRIGSLAFYEGASRRAEIQLSRLPGGFPFVLVLKQSILEDLLEKKLQERAGLKVHWNHRLAQLAMKNGAADATIEELALTGKGYVVPQFEMEVTQSLSARADFVVGADGQNSAVRRQLDIESQRVGEPQLFGVYELETDAALPPEMRIVFHEQTVNVLWPLGEKKCRWSFQLVKSDAPEEFPQKDRNRFLVAEAPNDQDTRHQLKRLLEARAPWFQAGIKDVGWATHIQFDHRCARQFGRSRAWLAGDAAHQTGPVGMQSMNLGLREGADLAAKLTRILREKAPLDLLETYNLEHRTEWEQMLGLKGGPKPGAKTDPWVRQRGGELFSCIPASGPELTLLLSQLGLEFEQAGPREAGG